MWTNTVLGMYDVIKSNLEVYGVFKYSEGRATILKMNKTCIYYNYYNNVHTVNCKITNCSDYARYVKIYNILYMGKLK